MLLCFIQTRLAKIISGLEFRRGRDLFLKKIIIDLSTQFRKYSLASKWLVKLFY